MIRVKGETIQTRKHFVFDRKLGDMGSFFSDMHRAALDK